jgi:hypothetical protein
MGVPRRPSKRDRSRNFLDIGHPMFIKSQPLSMKHCAASSLFFSPGIQHAYALATSGKHI